MRYSINTPILFGLFTFLLWKTALPARAQTTAVLPFRQLELAGTFTVFVTESSQYSVRLEGTDEQVKAVSLVNKAQKLTVGETGTGNEKAPVRVYLTCPQLNQIRVEGRVNLADLHGFAQDSLTLLVADGYVATLAATLNRLVVRAENGGAARVSGTFGSVLIEATNGSSVQLRGQGNQLRAVLYEGGKLDAFRFTCRQAMLRVQVASRANVTVTDSLRSIADFKSLVLVKGSAAVLASHYRSEKALIQIAYTFLSNSELGEATFYFRLASRLFPASWRANDGLSAVYTAQQQPDSARMFREKAQQLNPGQYKTAINYLTKGYRRATVYKAANGKGEKPATCQDYTLRVDGMLSLACVGNNLPEEFRRDGQEVWVKLVETKAGRLYDRGQEVVMNDCCGIIVRLRDLQPRTEE